MTLLKKLSNKQKLRIIKKCRENPVYFLKTFAKVTAPGTEKGTVPFSLYDYQEDLIRSFQKERFNVVLKSRQIGISTVTAGYAAWMMIFHRSRNIIVLATKEKTAANLVKQTKAIVGSLPHEIFGDLIKIDINNRQSFKLKNGSEIKAIGTSSDAGRSEALSLLIVDEAAWIPGMDDIWTGILPTISIGGSCIALSSPNGMSNWFYRTYKGAEAGDNNFVPHNLPWHVRPEFDQEWFDNVTKSFTDKEIAQEYLCSFIASGDTVIEPAVLQKIEENITEPNKKYGPARRLWKWKPYYYHHEYLICADVARGDGEDYSAFHVIDVSSSEVVAEFKSKIGTTEYAELLDEVGREYGDALLVVENNTIGWAVLQKLKEFNYPNLFYSKKATGEHVPQYIAEYSTDKSITPGFRVMKNRDLLINNLEENLCKQKVYLYSQRLSKELRSFIWKNGKAQAEKKSHDDLVMSLAVGLWVKDMVFSQIREKKQQAEVMSSAVIMTSKKLDTRVPGMVGYDRRTDLKAQKENMKKFPWLFVG